MSPCSFIKSHLFFITVTNLPLFTLVLLSTKKKELCLACGLVWNMCDLTICVAKWLNMFVLHF